MATAGCRAFTAELRSIAWPGKFKPDLPPRYDGTADPAEFLQLYELGIEAANGDEKVMANWFPMALKNGARTLSAMGNQFAMTFRLRWQLRCPTRRVGGTPQGQPCRRSEGAGLA